MILNKIQLRKTLRDKRRAISLIERHSAAEAAAALFSEHEIFLKNQSVGCYLANAEEFDCTPIIHLLWQAQKNCYLPLLSSTQETFLEFALYRPKDLLHSNRYHILEPVNTDKLSVKKLDLVFMPLVGFDSRGNRLGMGGGYYDRTFSYILTPASQQTLLIGLAYEQQCVDCIPHDTWDVPLHGVLTEKRLILF